MELKFWVCLGLLLCIGIWSLFSYVLCIYVVRFCLILWNNLIRGYMKQRCNQSLMLSSRLVVYVKWINRLGNEIPRMVGAWMSCTWRLQQNVLIWSSRSLSFTCIIGKPLYHMRIWLHDLYVLFNGFFWWFKAMAYQLIFG